ncbi:hypothetical protein NTE_00492 [Candidatus Nitrososphaera evergladensis SR1]|uniref:Uncharacterized protein n=1 Tax=Candidatus Nitrososphaera evergladensis SR1 TaxID=1459636 RepID=A0A075MMR7_9ARCH|nr:hypothetical protein [Candidatus Nitrososphaera evergladensis]AIF82573.1 hypothetical protein NTE_00492 [Candidatus Nitrososphaera evergladensis SR1]
MSESEGNKKPVTSGYTKEKLYELIPAVYRQHDAKLGKPLEDLVGIIAENVAMMEEDIGGLHDNWFIDTCDEWVTAYIADLVGARSLSASKSSSISTLEELSQRAYVANTIAYRRRKGTAFVLEQLARDVTQWGARAVEFFQLLCTTQNVNHVRLANHQAPDLRNQSRLELIETPFDTAAHTVEVRSISSNRGRYNIPNVGLFLYRLEAFPSLGTPAFKKDGKRFTFSPLGFDAPIFNSPADETSISHIAEEINVPAPISPRTLHDAPEKYYGYGKSIFLQVKYAGKVERRRIELRDVMVCSLKDWDVAGWQSPAAGDVVAIDPARGRISLPQNADEVVVSYYYGFSGKVGGGQYGRQDQTESMPQPRRFRIAQREVFVWSSVQNQATAHMMDILRNDFGIEWLDAGATFASTGRQITLTSGANRLTLSLTAGNVGALLQVNGVDKYEFFAREINGAIYVSKHEDTYGSIPEAKMWWDFSNEKQVVFEVADSLEYRAAAGDIDLDLPANSTVAIVAAANQRPILQKITVRGERGSRLVLDGLLIRSNIRVKAGDMSELVVSHCTLPPAGPSASLTVEEEKPKLLCSWDEVVSDQNQRKALAKFLKTNCAGWIPDSPPFSSDDDDSNAEKLSVTAGHNSLYIILADGEKVARVTLSEAGVLQENVYEFTVVTENGKKNMYVQEGNDDLHASFIRSITGRIDTQKTDVHLSATDSIIDAGSGVAISVHSASLQNSTVFGKTDVDRLDLASNSIFTGTITSMITQQGCVRFSYIPLEGSKTPQRYMCLPTEQNPNVVPTFTSEKYGNPGYAQLYRDVCAEIFAGADNGAEMGAFNHLFQAQRIADVKQVLNEYLRFGLEAGVFLVT